MSRGRGERVFISYRRKDAEGYAILIWQELSKRLNEKNVYFDYAQAAGADADELIARALDSCGVLLAIIGPGWLTAQDEASGERRLSMKDDYVAREIRTALERGVRVIPVLVGGQREVPPAKYLPEAIAPLAGRQAFTFTLPRRWTAEMDDLLRDMRRYLEPAEPDAVPSHAGGSTQLQPSYRSLTDSRRTFLTTIEELMEESNVAVCGPPGIGKADLLNALEELHPDATKVLPRHGRSLTVTHLRRALHRYCGPAQFPHDDLHGFDLIRRSLPPRALLLVHDVTDEESARAVLTLAERLPSTLRIVVTRRGPAAPLFEAAGWPVRPVPELPWLESNAIMEAAGLDIAQREEVPPDIAANPLLLRLRITALKGDKAPAMSDELAPVIDDLDLPELRALWLIGELPSSVIDTGLLVHVGLTHRGLELLVDIGLLRPVPYGLEVHGTLAEACRELVEPGRRQNSPTSHELKDLRIDAARYCVDWITGADFSAVDVARDNLMHLLKVLAVYEDRDTPVEALTKQDTQADLVLALIGDHLDDPQGYLPLRGFASLLLDTGAEGEDGLRGSLEATAKKVAGLRGARIEKNLGLFLHWANDAKAWPLLLSARARYLDLDSPEGRQGYAATTWVLGYVADDTGRLAEAEERYRELLERQESEGWDISEAALAVSLHLVGCSLYHQERHCEAYEKFEEALQVAPDEDASLHLRIERRRAYVELADPKRDTEAAAAELRRVRERSQGIRPDRDIARCDRHLGAALLELDRLEAAAQTLEGALTEFLRIGDQRGRGATLHTLAVTRRKQAALNEDHRQQLLDDARDYAVMSRNIARGVIDEPNAPVRIALDDPTKPMWAPVGAARADEELGRIAATLGDRDEELRRLRQACNIFEAIRHPHHKRLGRKLKDWGERDAAPRSSIKGAVLDLVDTLASVDPDAYELVKCRISSELGVDHDVFKEAWADSREEASKNWELTPEERILAIARKLGVPCRPSKAKALAEHEERLWRDEVLLKDETRPVLHALEERGIDIVLMANGSRSLIGLADRLRLTQPFLLSCRILTKTPEPSFYKRAQDELGLPPEQCMYVGDGGDRELEGAKVAGMFAVRLRLDDDKKPPYNHSESLDWHRTVDDLEELVELVDGAP